MTDHDHPTTPEQDKQIEHLVDTANMSYALARAAVLGVRLEVPSSAESVSKPEVAGKKSDKSVNPAKKRRYHPVSKVPDADSAYDPNWNVKRPKLTPEELAEQDALNTFGRAAVLNELDTASAERARAAEVPKQATAEELAERHAAVTSDWQEVQDKIDDDLIAHPEKDPIFDPPPDRRFFDPYNRKPTRD